MSELINRDRAAQAVEAYLCSQCERNHNKECLACPHLSGDEILSTVPTVGLVKYGRWNRNEAALDYVDPNGVEHHHGICSECGLIHDFIDGHTAQYNYCPQCGAKMEEPVNGGGQG